MPVKKQATESKGSAALPSPAKKARTDADTEETPIAQVPPASSAEHPTLRWMREVLNTLADDLKTLQSECAHDFGGISAFCPQGYKKSMTEHGEYECNVTLAQHSLLGLEHADVWPVVGAIKRLMTTVFKNADGDPMAVFPHAISVRTVSNTEAPAQCERLHRSAYLFAFLASWAAAKTAGTNDLAAAFFATAHRIRTKFVFLPNDDGASRAKWSLQEETDSMSENGATLVGYKKTFGVVGVQQDLLKRGLPHDANAVAAWFKSIRWNNDSDALLPKEVNRHIRVHGRLSANPLIPVRLDTAESRFGRRHVLAYLPTLDTLCGKTNVQSNAQLSTCLLLWVVEGAVALMLRNCVKFDISRDAFAGKIVPKLLLIRRIVLFLLHRFKYKSQPDTIYLEGYEPENVGKTLFGSWASFHRAYPVGLSMEQGTDDKTPAPAQPAAFLSKMAPSHVALIEFLASLMACQGDIDQIVSHAVSQDDKMSAESFFERRTDLAKDRIFDLADLTEGHKRDTKILEPAISEPVGAPEAQAVPAVAEAKSDAPEQQPDPEQLEPTPGSNSELHFSQLRFTEAARARLDSVEPKRFAAMVEHAQRRVATWVDIKILPNDPAAIPEYIKAAPAVQQMDKADTIMHVWCAGTGAESVHPARATRPYKYTVALDKTGLENAFVQATGAADGLFAKHPSVFVISDGRRPSSTKTITSMVTKAAKTAGAGLQTPFPFRLMHSNAEFSHNRTLRGYGRRLSAATVPEPLETLIIVTSKNFKVKAVARKYLDLPGTNRTRGLNNVPLKTLEVGITWDRRCEILQGSSKTAPVDDQVPDWMDDGEDDEGKTEAGEDIAGVDEGKTPTGEDEEGEKEDKTDKMCDLYPWEHSELVCRELLNCFAIKTVVHHNTNYTWPLACARHCIHFVGFARNEAHVEHIHKMLVAMVVAELIEGKDQGFLVTRFLSRQRSVGGSTEEDRRPEAASETAASVRIRDRVATETAASDEAGARGDLQDADSSSSSSSDEA